MSPCIQREIHIVKGQAGNLLSCSTAQQVGVLKFSINATTSPDIQNYTYQKIVERFPNIFDEIGVIKGKAVHFHIDPNIPPKHQTHRRIPVHVRKDVKSELHRIQSMDIIEEVEGAMPWVSPIVIVPKKSGEIHICVDMREANKAIKREKHLMPSYLR